MINFSKIKNSIKKIETTKQTSSKQTVPKNYNKVTNLTYALQDFSFKILASQVKAMAEQDKKNPVGKKFDILA